MSNPTKHPALAILLFCMTVVPNLMLANDASAAVVRRQYDTYSRRTVTVGTKRYSVDIITINLANPRLEVVTLTGTNGKTCYRRACQVRNLRSYIKEVSGFAGMSGTYSCPADYANCGPVGNFFWTVFNKRTHTFVNATQNRFNNGAMFTMYADKSWSFYPNTASYPYLPQLHGPAMKDPKFDQLTTAISNSVGLVDHGKLITNEKLLDTKQRTVKSLRSGLGIKGSTLSLVVARSSTVIDLGSIMRSLRMDYAMNLEGGGSTNLWYRGSYKVGPGRDIPNALVFRDLPIR